MAKNRKNKKHVALSKKEVIRNVQRRNLKSTLQSIYHDNVSLETTMSCQCVCCKIAMPQMNYCEFLQIITSIWDTWTPEQKIFLICTSMEYYFKHSFEKWGIQTLVKPCMLQDVDGKCQVYEDRPLSCRCFGIWPKDEYEKRVDRFAKAYEKYGLAREDFPLFSQCPLVERTDKSKELNMEIINSLYKKLDSIDGRIGDFTELQINQKQNYRTFHDWLMYKVFGEEFLSMLTTFIMSATKEQMEDQIRALKETVKQSFLSFDDKMKIEIKKNQKE